MTVFFAIVIVLTVAAVTVSAYLVGVLTGTCQTSTRNIEAATRNTEKAMRQVSALAQADGRNP